MHAPVRSVVVTEPDQRRSPVSCDSRRLHPAEAPKSFCCATQSSPRPASPAGEAARPTHRSQAYEWGVEKSLRKSLTSMSTASRNIRLPRSQQIRSSTESDHARADIGARPRSVSPLSPRHADPSATHRPQTPHTAPGVHYFMPATPLRGTLTSKPPGDFRSPDASVSRTGAQPETNGL